MTAEIEWGTRSVSPHTQGISTNVLAGSRSELGPGPAPPGFDAGSEGIDGSSIGLQMGLQQSRSPVAFSPGAVADVLAEVIP